MPEPSGAREIHPIVDFKGNGVTKDFSFKVVNEETEEADPKAESARESAASSPSTPTAEQIESGTPAQTPAVKENGKGSESIEPATSVPTTPSPEPSSPDSSTATSPGKSEPPAPVLPPPTSAPTPKQ